MKKFIGLFIVLCLLNLFAGIGTSGGGADTAEFPDIYIDEGVGGTHVGSIANPYDDISDINWTTGGDNSIFDWYAGAEDASATINLNRGDTWREFMNVSTSGSAAYPIIIRAYGGGADPIILGSEEVIGVGGDWTPEGGDIWSRALAVECTTVTFDSTNFGTEDVAPGAAYEWDWVANELFVYSVGNPTGVYTSIEAGQRSACIGQNANYITIDGIELKYANSYGVNSVSRTNPEVKNCPVSYIGGVGVRMKTPVGTILVDNCTVNYCGNACVQMEDVTCGGTISDCDISYDAQKGGWGHLISMPESANLTIDGNTIHHSALHSGCGGDSFYSNIFQYNEFYNCYYTAIDLSGDENHNCDDNIVRYNIFHDNTGVANCSGVYIFTQEDEGEHADNNKVYYNLFYDNNRGISITGGCDSNEVYNNVFENNGRSMVMTYQTTPEDWFPTNNVIKNNISYTTTGIHVWTNDTDAGDTNVWDYNCYYDEHADCFRWDGINYANLAAYQAGSGQEANSINSDPLFIDGTGNDFRLLMASLCINAGTDVGLLVDYLGIGIRHAPDIGAYEEQTNAIFMARLFKYLKERK